MDPAVRVGNADVVEGGGEASAVVDEVVLLVRLARGQMRDELVEGGDEEGRLRKIVSARKREGKDCAHAWTFGSWAERGGNADGGVGASEVEQKGLGKVAACRISSDADPVLRDTQVVDEVMVRCQRLDELRRVHPLGSEFCGSKEVSDVQQCSRVRRRTIVEGEDRRSDAPLVEQFGELEEEDLSVSAGIQTARRRISRQLSCSSEGRTRIHRLRGIKCSAITVGAGLRFRRTVNVENDAVVFAPLASRRSDPSTSSTIDLDILDPITAALEVGPPVGETVSLRAIEQESRLGDRRATQIKLRELGDVVLRLKSAMSHRTGGRRGLPSRRGVRQR